MQRAAKPGGVDGGVRPGPRVCFVGPMLGRHEGWVTTQGEILVDRFAGEGWEVRETSRQVGRLVRLVDTVSCLVRWHRSVDVVVIAVFSGLGFVVADVASLVARLLGLPVVMVLRGGNLPAHCGEHPTWSRRVLGRARVIVAPSAYLIPLAERAGVPVVHIPNVVDTAAYEGPPRRGGGTRLLWMRTFHHIYNPQLAVRAFEHVVAVHPEATLTLAGQDKGLLGEVRALVADRPWRDQVSFPGFLGPEQKVTTFAAHDVFLNTNRVDNAPVSVLEAAAAGMPIVATEVGGIPDLLRDGVTALLVPDDDAAAMGAAVVRIIEDHGLAERLATEGRSLARASAWPSVRDQWCAVFERVLAPGGSIVDADR